MNNYGKKGGTSATAGLKATWYEFETPDGEVLRRRSFHVDQGEAVAVASRHPEGGWSNGGIHPERPSWITSEHVTLRAVRVDGPRPEDFIRRGARFRHKRILDESLKGHAECIVTRVARGTVYYKVNGEGASGCFPVEEFSRWGELIS
jgi:hypothetical protein